MYNEDEALLDEHHEMVYGCMVRKTTKYEIERQIEKALKNSVAHVKNKKKERDLSSDSDFEWNPAAEVACAADRKRRTEKHTRQVTEGFGCHTCLCIVPASTSEPKNVCVVVEHWHGWADPMSGPNKWEEIHLECRSCAKEAAAKARADQLEFERDMKECEEWEKERAKEMRKRSSEQNKIRAEVQSKRLKKHVSKDGMEEFVAKLKKLKVPQLNEVCNANAVLKSGRKDQLIERLVGVRRYGSLDCCPICRSKLLELQYKGSSTVPLSVKCKYMHGMGRQCRFSKDLVQGLEHDVLQVPLRDSAAGDLASVGIVCS